MWLRSRCSGEDCPGFHVRGDPHGPPQEMLRRDESGICNAVSISEQDRSLGAFGLTEEPARISEWNHRRLVLDKTSAGIVDPELGERRMAYSAVKEPYDGKETKNFLYSK